MLFDKVTERISKLVTGLHVSPDKVAQKVFSSMTDGIATSVIDELSADVAINMISEDPDYEVLASRIIVSNTQKLRPKTFSAAMNLSGLFHYQAVERYDSMISPDRDYDFSYFGIKTLLKMYLGPHETPQYMFMRVALGIHGTSDSQMDAVKDTYDLMSQKYFTHATPTLFNAGTSHSQLSSCFLTGIKDDSITGIYDTLKDCAQISKWSGGIGFHLHNVRATGSEIRGTNGHSDGIIPMLRTFNATARYVNQCFRGDTPVYTKCGWIPICRIKTGDLVFTRDGTFQKVTHTHEREISETVLCVTTDISTNEVFVTKKHQIFVRKSEDSDDLIEISAEDLVPFVHKTYYPVEGFSVVTSVSEIYQECKVYDLTVENNHNYTTEIGLVHNSGKRKGSFAAYLEPWHADIFEFLELRLNQGDEEARCRDLFTALWIPDLFMKRLGEGKPWSLFCPDKAPGLSDVWGDKFEKLYLKYESMGLATKTIPIEQLWSAILKSQIETGTPYMLYKDHCNRKSNQRHLGTIKSSNLCVAPETKIKTSKGELTISDLVDQSVEVWNGEEWSEVIVHKTCDDAELLKVTLEDGKVLECTPVHLFYVNGKFDRPVPAKQLIAGVDKVPVGDQMVRVKSVEWHGRRDATYCFTEPKRHMGVFNGILTGQCTEIIEYTDPGEIAVCNLASICLPKFVNESDGTFDYVKLEEVTRTVTRNLDKIIDVNFYPVPEAERSNKKHRPVAIGVQGLADVYQMLGLDFGQGDLNRLVFETIYWAACSESVRIADVKGPHSSFSGSPWSQGLFQFDLWCVTPSDRYDWESIRGRPIRNSLLVGPMPTATTSQIMGNNECFEPYTSNMYLRRTLAGEFVVLNKHLVTDLKALGIWSKQVKDDIVRNQGSVQTLDIPEDLKNRYKTVWEISQKIIIDMAAERGPYICQSQSMNLHVEDPTASKLSSIHMYAWKQGLKTGMYYLRTRPKARAIQFTLEPEAAPAPACRRDNPGCISCSG
jgi:ribonucleotide reductase alpha subunit